MPNLFKLIKKTYKMAPRTERTVVLKNFASLSALQATTYFLPVVILPYLFRVLGPEKFGLIAFAQALVTGSMSRRPGKSPSAATSTRRCAGYFRR
jgi:hypothetical protein